MDQIVVAITRAHIAAGTGLDPGRCPITRGLAAALPPGSSGISTLYHAVKWTAPGGTKYEAETPAAAVRFMSAFDDFTAGERKRRPGPVTLTFAPRRIRETPA